MGVGTLPTAFGLTPAGVGSGCQFSSLHDGIIQFCMADGSVHTVRNDAPVNLFIAASGWFDGQSYNLDDIGN
jgi:hypothetical protein